MTALSTNEVTNNEIQQIIPDCPVSWPVAETIDHFLWLPTLRGLTKCQQ